MTKKELAVKTLDAVNATILEVVQSGTASASLSSGGGSRNYTRLDLPSLNATKQALLLELRGYANAGRPAVKISGVTFG